MLYLGWTRVDDGIGAVVYENGRRAVIFTSGDRWDMVLNDAQRVSPFAHKFLRHVFVFSLFIRYTNAKT